MFAQYASNKLNVNMYECVYKYIKVYARHVGNFIDIINKCYFINISIYLYNSI